MRYHYKESGLDNVWLVNGFRVRRTSYGEAISIEDVEGLYKAIARSLVEKAGTLNGKEIRFLRKHLGLSQRTIGAVLGSNEETVSNWERGKSAIPHGADRLLRAYWREVKEGAAKLKDLVERLAELDDQVNDMELRLKHVEECEGRQEEWKLAA
jgi:DNA-binding transcriptional regulator YiaG